MGKKIIKDYTKKPILIIESDKNGCINPNPLIWYNYKKVGGYMKVVVFSDAHGNRVIVERIISFNPDVDFFVSLGDSELPLNFLMDLDIISIKGNYPRDAGFTYESILEVGNKKLLLVHGHKFKVQKSLMKLLRHAIDLDVDIALYGHTHVAKVDKVDKLLLFNPGSIKNPRSKVVPSYLILEITDESVEYTFKEAETNITIEDI